MYTYVGLRTTTDVVAVKWLISMKNLSRFGFDEETTALLLDWCAANYKAQATEIICEAVKQHIRGRLDREPEMQKRLEAARKRRTGETKPKVVQMKSTDEKQ